MAPLAANWTGGRVVAGATVIGLTAVLGVTTAAPASAQARHLTINIDDTFEATLYTEACGTPIIVSTAATLNVTLVYNREGLLVREIDPSGGGKVTFSAPETGESFSFPFATTIFDYGAGARVGSTFTAKTVGLLGHVPGFIASDAGQVTFTGTVFGFEENGSPLLNFGDVTLDRGNRGSGEDIIAAICGALVEGK
jgi:hypothetical protein